MEIIISFILFFLLVAETEKESDSISCNKKDAIVDFPEPDGADNIIYLVFIFKTRSF